jgi:hypothetical protein
MIGASDLWVDHLSARADIPADQTKMVKDSHKAIVKPVDKDADSYRTLRTWIELAHAGVGKPKIAMPDALWAQEEATRHLAEADALRNAGKSREATSGYHRAFALYDILKDDVGRGRASGSLAGPIGSTPV